MKVETEPFIREKIILTNQDMNGKSVYIDIDEDYTAGKLKESFVQHGYQLVESAQLASVI